MKLLLKVTEAVAEHLADLIAEQGGLIPGERFVGVVGQDRQAGEDVAFLSGADAEDEASAFLLEDEVVAVGRRGIACIRVRFRGGVRVRG